MAEACSEAITEFITDQFGFSIDDLEGSLRAIGDTKPATITFLLINLYNLSRCHLFSLLLTELKGFQGSRIQAVE
jgi:hypothetical protein